MFLSAQSMAVGTIMVRWVSKYSDPIMATGWVYYPQMNNHPCYVLVCVTCTKALFCYRLYCFNLAFLCSILANDFCMFPRILI